MSGNVVSVLSPTMTNEVLVSWSRLTLDNSWRDPSKVSLEQLSRSWPVTARASSRTRARTCRSTSSRPGGARAARATCGRRRWTCSRYNDALQFSDKLTKIAGSHGLKFGFSVERGQKQQNFENSEFGEYQFDPWATGGTGGPVADLLTGRLANYSQGTRDSAGRVAVLEHRRASRRTAGRSGRT